MHRGEAPDNGEIHMPIHFYVSVVWCSFHITLLVPRIRRWLVHL